MLRNNYVEGVLALDFTVMHRVEMILKCDSFIRSTVSLRYILHEELNSWTVVYSYSLNL